jgi:hypothetical protein
VTLEFFPNTIFLESFSENLALLGFNDSNGQYRYSDKNEFWHIVLPKDIDNAHTFKEGLASILQNKKWGFIDKKKHTKIEPKI